MATLERLPAEILYNIATFLSYSLKDLSHLAMVNSAFYQTVSPLVYRSIDLELRRVDDTWNPKCELLIRSMSERLQLAKYINHIGLRTFKLHDEETTKVNAHANNLLRPLRNLHSLELEAKGPLHFRYAFTGAVNGAFSTLERVRLSNRDMEYDDVCIFLHLKNIRKVKVEALDYRTLRPGLIDATLFGTTSLLGLEITTVHLPEEVLTEIVRLPKSLSSLSIKTPGLQKPSYTFGGLDFANKAKMARLLSPSKITNAIQPVQTTLTSLYISENSHTSWPNHDRTRLDLSSFTALQLLSVPSHLIFPQKLPRPPSRNGLYRLLPPSLHELSITFEYDHCVLYNGDQSWKAFHNRGEDVDEERYAWLLEIAEYKENATPGLKKIAMWEKWKHGCRTPQVSFPWCLPKEVRKLFDKNKIDLDVWMRRPRNWKTKIGDGN